MGRRIEPAVIVELPGGRAEHPCPPDNPALAERIIRGLTDAVTWQVLADARWSYRTPQDCPQPGEGP